MNARMLKSMTGVEMAGRLVDDTNNTQTKAQADRAIQIPRALPTFDQVISPRRRAARKVQIATVPLRMAAQTTT